jgi:hypothetical protein
MSDLTTIEQDSLYQSAVDQAKTFVKGMLNDEYPNLDLTSGRVLCDLLLEPGAIVNAYNQINIDRVRRETSLYEINQDPTIASTLAVDRILSNFNVTRKSGTKATGYITIFINTSNTFTISQNTNFTINNLSYITTGPYVATTSTLTSTAQRPIIQRTSTTWSVTIPVTAAEVGSSYAAKTGSVVQWVAPPTNYISAVVESDFTGGEDEETNADLINRLDLGVTAAVMGGRRNLESLITTAYPQVLKTSIIGFGDPEMQRDRHNIFSMSTGGKGDIYLRTTAEIYTKTVKKSCTLIDSSTNTFQVTIDKDDYSGFYTIDSIYPITETNYDGSLEIVQEQRGIDLSEETYIVPDVDSIIEGAYSKYQTAVVQFKDPNADLTTLVDNKLDYNFRISGMPLIGDIQDYLSSRAVRNIQSDYLVRAGIPFYVSVSLEIEYVKGDTAVDATAVKNAILEEINKGISSGFNRDGIQSANIIKAAQSVLTGRSVVKTPITLTGKLRKPSGTTLTYLNNYNLEIPEILSESITSRTVSVFTSLSMISVTVEQVETLPV